MNMFPHTVTVYNTDTDENYRTTTCITVLRGVFLDVSKAVNVRESALEGADAVDLYIPFNVEAVDGVTGQPQKYTGPIEFWKEQTDKSGLWTLSDSGGTFFIKGEVVEPDKDKQALEMAYDHVYNVTKVDEKDYGGLRHFEVGGA